MTIGLVSIMRGNDNQTADVETDHEAREEWKEAN